jgi:predicted glycogen debranching enzyme
VGFTPNGLLAGYHWFEEWGRDTMISLPGLTLVTGKFGVAKQILRAYVSHMNQGLIPNRIPNAEEKPHYNTADATLWLFWAVSKYLAYTKDREFLEELLPKLLESIEWHVRGTYYEIGMDEEDGLLRAGDAGTQLTWMDAKVSDWVVTPRHGKPVEINALWQHALQFLEEFGAQHAGPAASEVAARFNERFWNEETGYLNDVVDGAAIFDSSLRPNQVIALSLPSPLLDPDKARRALAAVERDLLTPYGLRTLSPHDPRYKGRYEGDQWHRDGAYHQGTVWPWLLGPFITVAIKYAPNKEAARKHYREYLQPLWRHLQKAGLGSISEIFDGDAPHTPRGCIAQAWSVAEVLRVLAEELKES